MEMKAPNKVISCRKKDSSSCVPRGKEERKSADTEPLVGRETFSLHGFSFFREIRGSIIYQD